MPIIDLQRRFRELGRIRIGQVVTDAKGKKRPEKLETFRLTSASRPLLEKVAQLYGGQVTEWDPQGKGAKAWEVLTTSNRLPVYVPRQPISQYMETWSGGGCRRRCDGVTELLSCQPCICGPNPEEKVCKPTTRLNVILRDVEGIGVWRLESHGWNSAIELPDVAEFLARVGESIPAFLALEERVTVRDGKTSRFMVPHLEAEITPTALMAGGSAPKAIESIAPPKAIEASAPPVAVQIDADDSVRAAIMAVDNLDDLRALWDDAGPVGLRPLLMARVKELTPKLASPVSDEADDLYAEVLKRAPEDWTTSQVESDFKSVVGVDMETAGVVHLKAYLAHLAGSSE